MLSFNHRAVLMHQSVRQKVQCPETGRGSQVLRSWSSVGLEHFVFVTST